MASPRKIYKRTGLRRDKNFADLSDSKQALNNLLDTLVDTADGTFISEDLQPIRTIFTTGISAGEYQGFIASSVKETSPDGSINAVTPAITYQNRLDNFRVTSGEPRLNGGNGLTAKYFNQDQVEDTDDVFTGITTASGESIPSDTFWESGQFDYTGKIHPQSVNAAGGVQWEGFFVPTQTGTYGFSVSSTLGFTIDFETEGYTSGVGTYTEYARIGLTTSTPLNSATTSGTDTVTIPVANVVNVGTGMTVTAASNDRIKLGSKVTGVDRSTGAITLENADGNSINTSGTTSVTFGRTVGESSSISYSTYILERSRKYRVRYRVFVPAGTTSLTGISRSINFGFNQPGSSGTPLRYNNLYSLDYDFSEAVKGGINKFLDESILLGGNKENGGERIGGLTQPEYVKVLTDKKVDIKYAPKGSLSQIERKTSTVSWSAGTKILSIGDTTNIEVGNYVFATTTGLTGNINTPVRVIQIVINQFVVIDTPTTGTGSGVTLTFVDHRGFVKRVTASSNSAGLVTISNGDTVGLKSKQIAIWDSSEKHTGITTTGSSSQFNITLAQVFNSLGPNSNNFTLSDSVFSDATQGTQWGTFLRAYGVWHAPGSVQTVGQTYSTTYTLNIKSPGNYTLEHSGDDVGTITFDGTTVATIPQATDAYRPYQTSQTTTISNVTAGPHTIVASISNTSFPGSDNWNQNPAGIAWQLTRILPNPLTFTSKTVYFYESRGLIDKGLDVFCPTTGSDGTICFLVTADAPSGSSTLTVSNSGDLVALGANKTVIGFPFADNTKIAGFPGNNQITLNTPTIKNIVAGSRFTATVASDDRSLCCPPTDTSPPFNPTEEGLETILGGADNLKITGGNLIFNNLTATVNTSNITALTGTNNSSKRIELKGGDGVAYNLLCE